MDTPSKSTDKVIPPHSFMLPSHWFLVEVIVLGLVTRLGRGNFVRSGEKPIAGGTSSNTGVATPGCVGIPGGPPTAGPFPGPSDTGTATGIAKGIDEESATGT